ncbi:hypothetical protein GW17_00023138 [Ensete ventricosum]|nr:hypothetical protein GW17_00023138 [Ensete ventricosum]
MATASPLVAGCNQGPPARKRPAAARPHTRGGRMQPRPPYKGAGGCGHEPCKGRPTAGAATARGNDRLWPGCSRRACKGRLPIVRLQGATAYGAPARGATARANRQCLSQGWPPLGKAAAGRKGQPSPV